MQFSTIFSIVLPLFMASQVAAQRSYCRPAADSNTDFSQCTGIRGVCVTACPRECGAGFSLHTVNIGEGDCSCFCQKK
ncbi:hypothetical protein Cob_v012234 [Colletotrichum orbiculare MAFF 240422]|uniref:Uncharacterized protein n=1 Tax=Colletotrichum orbiculare (strain 104-T / ATCC 96160 / CBS 514.97 / LARS 414 / MAFF 240422) TaxID=1213857 RepID=A0A484FA82_COLOR|nr:hypothetical protein Cob_v012234 [Colletotrichum orbiculare MAFF 240422]